MSYDYLTPEEFMELTGMDLKAISPIEPADNMTLIELIRLSKDTVGRFTFVLHPSGLYAECAWVNYYQTDSGNYKIDNNTGSAVLNDRQSKDIVLA